jgi:hypothetical protein
LNERAAGVNPTNMGAHVGARDRLQADGADLIPRLERRRQPGGRPEQFREAIRKEIEVWRKVVSEAGVKAE